MQPEAARAYVQALYEHLLRRAPAVAEFEHWIRLAENDPPESLYYAFINSPEYKRNSRVSSVYPSGHYYSAVVDPSTVVDYVARERQTSLSDIPGIHIPIDKMESFWRRMSPVISRTPFSDQQTKTHRFYYGNNTFEYGDAIGLRAILADRRPELIIEIGSGFSSACMLDCVDEFELGTKFIFIDPYADRLKRLLRPGDAKRVTIIEQPVQLTELSLYGKLRPNDILFIDSTHVLKTGSDVHYEFFHILPSLAHGVVVHFHDIQFPFEYPDRWIFDDNFSWNEIYALRAFLMYNADFQIYFWGSCLARERPRLIRDVLPLFLRNSGGSLWLERT